MSTTQTALGRMTCPQCNRAFSIGTEEYCPHDGERLHFSEASAQPEAINTPSREVAATPEANLPPTAEGRPDSASSEPASEAEIASAVPVPNPDLSTLEKLIGRFGIRRKPQATPASVDMPATGDNSSQRWQQAQQQPTSEVPGEEVDDPLPESLKEAGWRIAGPLSSDEFADVWPLDRSGVPARFTRYRGRVLTSAALYQRLLSTQSTALPAVLDAGTVNLRGHAHTSFDLCGFAVSAGQLQRLDEWMLLAPPSEAKALALLPALAQMQEALHSAGLAPITLHPSQIFRHSSGRLQLSHVAALTEVGSDEAIAEYRPELDRNPLVSRLWSAPELSEQLVVYPSKSSLFSVGQILAAALWGQPQDLAGLRAGQVPLQQVADTRLARVLQGCLWAHNLEGRWSLSTFNRAMHAPLSDLPPMEDWARLGPQAMGVAFPLNGRAYWRVDDLVAAAVAPENWAQATVQIDALLDWVEAGSPWASVVPPLRQQMVAGNSTDHVLVRLARQVRPDLPLTWRSLNFEDSAARSSLTHLAQRNLAADAKPEEVEQLQALFGADLRGAFVRH